MPILSDYNEFGGRHWETGTVRNFFAYRGVKAPHTGQPFSEALLLGISGGVVMGYFSFAYEGYDPQARILTRNTFDPFETLLARMGVVQDLRQTASPDKGRANLIDALDEGLPAIVWTDMFSLPYNALDASAMWAMFPILVYGYDETAEMVWIADRSRVGLTITPAQLHAARARVKKDRFRLLTLDYPDPDKLPAAVTAGIWQCIRLFLETPPKGSANNFGLRAYRYWAELLTRPGQRMSWAKEFPAGIKLWAGLTTAFTDICTFGKDEAGEADRSLYAGFLDEASVILSRPALREVAEQFRASAAAWRALAWALLPDTIPWLAETRDLLLRRHALFLSQGGDAFAQIKIIDARLAELRIVSDYESSAVQPLLEHIRSHVLAIHDLEKAAITQLQAIMASSGR
jgi:hypothetical protein